MNWFTKLYAWACERLYYELAWSYDGVSWLVSLGRWSSWRRVALAYLPTAPLALLERGGVEQESAVSLPVLELGFGTGELLSEMAHQGLAVYGLELSPAMHKITRAKLQRRVLAVPRVRALAQAMPWADGSFDSIVSTFPAPYILDPATLRECARLLRKPQPEAGSTGGRLIIVGLWIDWENAIWRKVTPLFYGAPGTAMLHGIQQRVAAAGLTVTITEQRVGPVRIGVVIGDAIGSTESQRVDSDR